MYSKINYSLYLMLQDCILCILQLGSYIAISFHLAILNSLIAIVDPLIDFIQIRPHAKVLPCQADVHFTLKDSMKKKLRALYQMEED